MSLRPYQQAAVEAVYRYLREHDDNPCIVLPTGCHAAGHPILMFDGTTKPVEQVMVGDFLMGPDSRPRRVLSLCRGEDEMYRVVPKRGESFVVNGDHVLSLVCTREGKPYPCNKQGGEVESVSVREFLKKPRYWRHLRKLYKVPVEFSFNRDLPIPPYILGILIGDGCLREVVTLTTADEELADSFSRYAESVGCYVTVSAKVGNCSAYSACYGRGRDHLLKASLKAIGLDDHDSSTKFIPHEYLTASRFERLSLFAGLMDTDGSRSKSGFEYTTKSEELASDVLFLARSLGFAANCQRKYSSCQTGAGAWYFRIHIYGDLTPVPCRLPRKHPRIRQIKKDALRMGFDIESHGTGRFFGFVLDANHLYLDGHFVVHHNSGKTPVLATLCKDAVLQWSGRVLVLAHIRELLQQAADKLSAICPEVPVGLYSAGLGSRDTLAPVIVAGIQSAYKRAADLGRFDLVIIDETHLITPDGDGMYRTLLADLKAINPHIRLVGLTATPFRLASGPICGPDRILNAICYEIGVRELIRDGYLSPLITKAGHEKADTSQLHVRGGEFVTSEVEALMDDKHLVTSACHEIVNYTRDRKSCLIFASGIQHATHIAQTLQGLGKECACVFGDTLSGVRDQVLEEFRQGKLKYLCNVNVLTTGFDAPNIDCIALMRPTLSPGLFYQMTGRGFRLHPGKANCLVLDFGGNVLRHGPVDAIRVESKPNGMGAAPAKECPKCHSLIATGFSVCPDCGYEFPPPERNKHDARATDEGILSGQVTITKWPVTDAFYAVHAKRGAPPDAPRTMRVEYQVGLNRYYSEWICFEHDGFARQKAEAWWRRRCQEPVPDSIEEAVRLANEGALCATQSITVRSVAGEPFPRITDYELVNAPKLTPEPEYWPADDSIPF